MLDRETKKRIADFFDPSELVEYLGIEVDDVIEIFEEDIEECLDEIEELIGYKEDETEEDEEE